jgi:nitrogen fixation protein NifU and related proteins
VYSDIVNDHVSRPRNVGPLEGATHEGTAGVPGDGPYMILWLEVADRRILRAAYKTYGCIAAIACGSITATLLAGLPMERALLLEAEDVIRVLGGLPEGKEHCAVLCVQALRRAVQDGEEALSVER